MDGLYDYMTEEEYTIHVIESVVDNRMKHLNTEFDKAMLEHSVNLSDIETKIIMESGTIKNLEDLYMFEAEEMKQKTGGVLTKLINTVRGFFKKIKEFLFGKEENSINDNAMVTPKSNPDDVIKEGNSILASMRDFKNKHKRGIKMAATSVAIGAGSAIAWKLIKPQIKKLQNQSEEVDKSLEEIQNLIIEDNNMNNQELINAKVLINRAENYGKHVLGFSHLSQATQDKLIADDKKRTEKKLDKIDYKASSYSRQIGNLERQISELEGTIENQKKKYEKMQKGKFHPIAKRRDKKLTDIENTNKFLRTNQDKDTYAKLSQKDPARYIAQIENDIREKENTLKLLRRNYNDIVAKKTKMLK